MALIKCPECKKKISDQCGKCPNCGYPLDKICEADENQTTDIKNIDEETAKGKKSFDIKSLIKKWWFWVAVGVVIAAITTTTILLLNRDTKPKFDKEGNPVFVELTNEVYTNAQKYKGYHINIKGKVFQVMSDNGSVKGIQIWIDPDTCEQNMMIYYNTDAEIKQGDYVICSGYIDSIAEYKNAYDAKLYAPLVISSDLVKATYIDVMSPTTETITPENLKREKYGYSISIDKIEFAEKETRVYATVKNNGKALLNIGDAVIVQNGKQYNSTDNYEADYEEIPYEIVKGVSSSGIVLFPAISINDFELTIDVHSDDYDEEIDKFIFKISKDCTIQEPINEKPDESKPTTSSTTTETKKPQDERQKAINSAKNLISNYNSANRAWVRDWLINIDGYSYEVAQYAVENISIDWSKYALLFANECLELNPNVHTSPVNSEDISEQLLEQEFTSREINDALSSINWNKYALDYLYLLETWGDITTKENAEERLSWYGFNQEQINYAINNCSIQWQLEDAND